MPRHGNGLTDKQTLFVEHYLQTWNATTAARRAGYKGGENTLQTVGWENLRKPAIRDIIDARLKENKVTTDELVGRLRSIASGDLADLAEALKLNSPTAILEKAKELGLSYLIKKIKTKGATENSDEIIEVEFHDPVRAIDILARHMMPTKTEIELPKGTIEVNLVPLEKDPKTGRLMLAENPGGG